MNCAYKKCCRFFRQNSPAQRYCSSDCRNRNYHGAGLTDEMRVKRPPKPRGRPARCKWCRGPHTTDKCPQNGRAAVRQYGTVVDGQYVPPPGVKVRHIVISNFVHGDTVGDLLNARRKP